MLNAGVPAPQVAELGPEPDLSSSGPISGGSGMSRVRSWVGEADGFTVFRSYSHHIAADLHKRRHSAFAAPTLSIYMSVRAGIQAAHRTDSHGHCPQNRLTCANQQAERPKAHPARANAR